MENAFVDEEGFVEEDFIGDTTGEEAEKDFPVLISILEVAGPKQFWENTKNWGKRTKKKDKLVIRIFDLSSLQGVAITVGVIAGIVMLVKWIKKDK